MQIKSELRQFYRAKRKSIADKELKDRRICENFLNSALYTDSKTILCYAALKDEINTDYIIEKALRDGKGVAVPICTDKNGSMEFYYINSLSELCEGTYGIREPNPDISIKVDDYSGSLCLVPALAFDKSGHRLGYGKGYYDRFIKKFIIISAGLCYNELLSDALPAEKHDEAVDFIITENEITCLNRRIKYD